MYRAKLNTPTPYVRLARPGEIVWLRVTKFVLVGVCVCVCVLCVCVRVIVCCLTLIGPDAAKRQPSGAPATQSVAARRDCAVYVCMCVCMCLCVCWDS